MAFDAKAFLADVLSKVDVDKRQGIEEAFGDQAVQSALDAGYLRQDDYSRRQDELKSAREAAEAEVASARGVVATERQQLVDWYERAVADYSQKAAENQRYRAEYGDLDGAGEETPVAQVVGLTREEHDRLMNEALNEHSQKSIRFADLLTDLKLEHQKQFDERLNTEELFAHQSKTRMPLDVAYKDFISERVGVAQAEKHAKLVEQAREEGLREGRSQQSMPVRPDASPVQRAFGDPSNREGVGPEAAAAAWRQSQAS